MPLAHKDRLIAHVGRQENWSSADITELLDNPERKGHWLLHEGLAIPNSGDAEPKEVLKAEFFLNAENGEGFSNFTHSVNLRFSAKKWKPLTFTDILNGMRAVVAYDLKVEPQVPARRVKDVALGKGTEQKLAEHFSDNAHRDPQADQTRDAEEMSRQIFDLENFTAGGQTYTPLGHLILAETRKFMVLCDTDMAMTLATDARGKDTILTHAYLWKKSKEPWSTEEEALFNNNREEIFFTGTPDASNIVRLLMDGHSTEIQRSHQKWNFLRVFSDQASKVRQTANRLMKDRLHIQPRHFSVISTAPQQLFIAVHREAFEAALMAHNASSNLLACAQGRPIDRQGLSLDDYIKQAYEHGAHLKYVLPERAAKGETFLTVARECENYEFLAAHRNIGHIRAAFNSETDQWEPLKDDNNVRFLLPSLNI